MVDQALDPRLAERAAIDPELEEKPDFHGRPYNLSVWRQTTEEHNYMRAFAPRALDMAPDFSLPTLDGGELTLSSLRGKPVMIEFGSIT